MGTEPPKGAGMQPAFSVGAYGRGVGPQAGRQTVTEANRNLPDVQRERRNDKEHEETCGRQKTGQVAP